MKIFLFEMYSTFAEFVTEHEYHDDFDLNNIRTYISDYIVSLRNNIDDDYFPEVELTKSFFGTR